jgi:sodium/potassium-transporting ATPase subunit alpha
VLRDGIGIDIDVAAIVAGDLLVLREGDRIAADARLVEAHGLKVDNAPLTGESEPQLRTAALAGGERLAARNLVFSGTLVTKGLGPQSDSGDASNLGAVSGCSRSSPRPLLAMWSEERDALPAEA